MSSLVSPTLSNTSTTTGCSISTSLRISSRRTEGDCENDTTATGRTDRRAPAAITGTPPSEVLRERLVGGVRLTRGFEVLDRGHRRPQVLLVHPHRLHPHAHADLARRDL